MKGTDSHRRLRDLRRSRVDTCLACQLLGRKRGGIRIGGTVSWEQMQVSISLRKKDRAGNWGFC